MWPPRTALILAPQDNQPGKHDATGAFQPGARAFQSTHGLTRESVVLFPNHAARAFLAAIRAASNLDAIAYFGHGTRNSLSSASIGPILVPVLADAIRSALKPKGTVVFYACSAGNFRDNGFANSLAQELDPMEVAIYGHTVPGHSFYNPYVTTFYNREGSYGFGEWVVDPSSRLWPRWRTALRTGHFWAKFPFMSIPEVDRALRGV